MYSTKSPLWPLLSISRTFLPFLLRSQDSTDRQKQHDATNNSTNSS